MVANPGQIAQRMMEFQKLTFSGFYDALTLVQNQAASNVTQTLDRATWLPPESRQTILSWMDACQDGREQFKSFMQESFSSIENCFDLTPEKPMAQKAKKKVAESRKKTTAGTAKKSDPWRIHCAGPDGSASGVSIRPLPVQGRNPPRFCLALKARLILY